MNLPGGSHLAPKTRSQSGRRGLTLKSRNEHPEHLLQRDRAGREMELANSPTLGARRDRQLQVGERDLAVRVSPVGEDLRLAVVLRYHVDLLCGADRPARGAWRCRNLDSADAKRDEESDGRIRFQSDGRSGDQ